MAALLMLALFTPPHKDARRHPAHRRAQRSSSVISPARATQIQEALVRAGYLKRASGHWDAATIAALKKFQAGHHWQTRFIPDARALLALGLVHTGATVP